MRDYILWELKGKGSDTKEKVVRAAAKIVIEEIWEMNFSKDHYPGVSEIKESEKWFLDLLQLFMKVIVPTMLKHVNLSQCIVQAARPRTVIAPMPIGVGLNIDKSTRCKQLITPFSRLGFLILPGEVSQFKQSVIEDIEKDDNQEKVHDGFKKWVSDNVNHNIATLMSRGTFHDMGRVCVDPQPTRGFSQIPWLKKRQPAGVFTRHWGGEIVPYQQASLMMFEKFNFESVSQAALYLSRTCISSSGMTTQKVLWHSAWFLSSSEKPCSNRSEWEDITNSKLYNKLAI